tara:strand:+ start:376 stop:573 length:198 start_codon:yes stop_codon:yes gene_type:complete
MEINVYYKNVYGTDYCYPACDDANIFACIAKQKTLPDYTLERIQKLGYKINVILDPKIGVLNKIK